VYVTVTNMHKGSKVGYVWLPSVLFNEGEETLAEQE
jgi:hypothetical protein